MAPRARARLLSLLPPQLQVVPLSAEQLRSGGQDGRGSAHQRRVRRERARRGCCGPDAARHAAPSSQAASTSDARPLLSCTRSAAAARMATLALCAIAPSLAPRARRAQHVRSPRGALRVAAAAASDDSAAPAVRPATWHHAACPRNALMRPGAQPAAAPPAAAAGSCPKCGVAKGSMKCDGSGRQQGGIGALPGFGWWPIMVRARRGAALTLRACARAAALSAAPVATRRPTARAPR